MNAAIITYLTLVRSYWQQKEQKKKQQIWLLEKKGIFLLLINDMIVCLNSHEEELEGF